MITAAATHSCQPEWEPGRERDLSRSPLSSFHHLLERPQTERAQDQTDQQEGGEHVTFK